jgi:8-oxo-dGTP pyrophosphatase MutT (NUDIX family)
MENTEKNILCQHRWMSLGVGDRGEPFIQIDGDGVLIVPITENNEVLMIVEPSVTEKKPVLGLPAGAVDPGETSKESANRELQEESGYKSEQLDYLGTIRPLSRHSNWRMDVYLGRKLMPSKMEGDESYAIEIKKLPFDQIEEAIMTGRFDDSNVISALYLARLFLNREILGKRDLAI